MLDRTRREPAQQIALEEQWQRYLASLANCTRRPTPRSIDLDHSDAEYSAAQGSHFNPNGWGR